MSGDGESMSEPNDTTVIGAQEASFETSLATVDGLDLKTWVHPAHDPIGVVLLTHGLGEHSGRYEHVIAPLRRRRIAVVRWDLRGHGRSAGLRGHAPSLDCLMNDISLLAEFVERQFPGLPRSLWGHSLGGNLVTNWVLRRPQSAASVRSVVLSAPWFLLTESPSPLKVWLLRAVAKVSPKFVVPARFRSRALTRNRRARREYENDPLIHRQITARMVVECHDAALWALERAGTLTKPVFAVHGGDDPVTSPEGTRRFCETAPCARFRLLPGGVHEPHNDEGWQPVLADLVDWLENHLTSP